MEGMEVQGLSQSHEITTNNRMSRERCLVACELLIVGLSEKSSRQAADKPLSRDRDGKTFRKETDR